MKPHPRIRKTVKWGGAAATVILLAAGIGSRWWWAAWTSPRGDYVWLTDASITILRRPTIVSKSPAPEPGWSIGRVGTTYFHWGNFWRGDPKSRDVRVPLWLLASTFLAATVLAWRLDALARRRERAGHCAKCGYDRRGLAAGAVCPECGSEA